MPEIEIGGDEQLVAIDGVAHGRTADAIAVCVEPARIPFAAGHRHHVFGAVIGRPRLDLSPCRFIGIGVDVEVKSCFLQSRRLRESRPPEIPVFADVGKLDGQEILGGVIAFLGPGGFGFDAVFNDLPKRLGFCRISSETFFLFVFDAIAITISVDAGGDSPEAGQCENPDAGGKSLKAVVPAMETAKKRK